MSNYSGDSGGLKSLNLNIEKIRTGLFVDLYRGSRIYKDMFHLNKGLGGHSYIKFGICFVPAF